MPVTSAVQREGVIPQSQSRGLLSIKLKGNFFTKISKKPSAGIIYVAKWECSSRKHDCQQ